MTLCFQFVFRFRHLVRYRKIVCLYLRNRLRYTLDILCRRKNGSGKYNGWHFCDLDPRSRLWDWLRNICLHDKMITTKQITTKPGSCIHLVMFFTWIDFEAMLLETFSVINFFRNFPIYFKMFFSKPSTLLAISQKWLIWLAQYKKKCIGWMLGSYISILHIEKYATRCSR